MNELNVAHALPVAVVNSPVERLATLFDVHYDRLYRLARRLTASADDALDLISAVTSGEKHPFVSVTARQRSVAAT